MKTYSTDRADEFQAQIEALLEDGYEILSRTELCRNKQLVQVEIMGRGDEYVTIRLTLSNR